MNTETPAPGPIIEPLGGPRTLVFSAKYLFCVPHGKEEVAILIFQMRKLGHQEVPLKVTQPYVLTLGWGACLPGGLSLSCRKVERALGAVLACGSLGSHGSTWAAALTAAFQGLLGRHGNPHATVLGLILFLVLGKYFVEYMPFVQSG